MHWSQRHGDGENEDENVYNDAYPYIPTASCVSSRRRTHRDHRAEGGMKTTNQPTELLLSPKFGFGCT